MEYSDVYDKDRKITGKTVLKGDKLTPGEYYLAVHVWIMNNKGQFLIQKRASTVLYNPNMWSLTSGAVIAGEDSYGACVRGNNFCDVWLVNQDVCLNDCILQVEEVSDIKWASRKEIFKMIAEGEFVPYPYIRRLFEKI